MYRPLLQVEYVLLLLMKLPKKRLKKLKENITIVKTFYVTNRS